MQIKKIISTNKSKWPKKVKMDNGVILRLPQQKKWNSFNRTHGCSIAAVTIALQFLGIRMTPDDIYNWCKKNVSGYTGSKLGIYGSMIAINGITQTKNAEWHPITSSVTSKKTARKNIKKAVKEGCLVLVEQSSPIHTNTIIAKRTGGVWIATNGVVKKSSIKRLVREALKGKAGKENQDNWYVSGHREREAGYVIVKP